MEMRIGDRINKEFSAYATLMEARRGEIKQDFVRLYEKVDDHHRTIMAELIKMRNGNNAAK
jgi:hypothetical protein